MKSPMHQAPASMEAICAVIARSPIIVLPPVTLLPPGFDEADLAVLNWLASEGQHLRRDFALLQ